MNLHPLLSLFYGEVVEEKPSTKSATMEPIMTLAFIRTGMRRSSVVNQTRISPLLMNRPLNGMITTTCAVSALPQTPSTVSIF